MAYTSAKIDLVTLIEQKAGITLTLEANHYEFGPEYWGSCPFCKRGDNRFHVWPEGSRPHYWCRICGKEGSAPWFLVEYCNMSFGEACEELGIEDDDMSTYTAPSLAQLVNNNRPPHQAWQKAGKEIVQMATHYLWHSLQGRESLHYLIGRGLTEETIKKYHLGYMPLKKDGRWYMDSFENWGIEPTEEQKKKGGVRVPNGIIIPWFEGDRLWKIAIKRPGEKMDYGQVMGSAEGLYGVHTIRPNAPVVMVEGEFDCLSVLQEAGDITGCVATGSATRGRLMRWIAELSLASYVLQAFDADEAGEKGADYWVRVLPNGVRFPPFGYKDVNEMLQKLNTERDGYSVRQWVQDGIWAAQLPPPDAPPVISERKAETPIVRPEIQRALDIQSEYERLIGSEHVMTPDGPGRIWDMSQLRQHIERDKIRVTLDHLKGAPPPHGATRLYPCKDLMLEPAQIEAF